MSGDKLTPAERARFAAERARRPKTTEGWFDHHRRVDWDDPIAQIVAKMVEELEKRPHWRTWKLSLFRDCETSCRERGPYKGHPTDSCSRYNEHYNALFHVAVQALMEGYRMAQVGEHFVLLDAAAVAATAWGDAN